MKEAIRHFVVEKAREVFGEKGYSHTTIEDIANASDISKPTLYNYFSGKDDLFRSVIELSNSEFEEVINPVVNGQEEFPEKLKILIQEILKYVNKNRGLLKIAFHESHMFIEALDNDRSGGFRKIWESKVKNIRMLKGFFQEGIKKGYINEDIPLDLIAVFFSGIISEFSLGYILGMEKMAGLDFNQITDHIITIFSKGIFKK